MKNCPTVNDLKNIIDTAKLAVDESEFGPIFVRSTQDINKKQCDSLAWSVFSLLIAAIMQKVDFTGDKNEKHEDER